MDRYRTNPIKITKRKMKTATEYLDEMSDDSLEEGLTKNDWLDFLREFRDELDLKISMVNAEVTREERESE